MVARLLAKQVEHTYPGGVRALQGVDLELGAGELLAVIGPNGSGKSTLMRCLAGVLVPQRGEIRIDGQAVLSMPPRQRARRVAFVPQYLPALPDVLALDFVQGGRYAYARRWRTNQREERQLARAALERADAGEFAARMMTDLSAGQRQRVLFARALAQATDVVLFDEPTSALDPEHQLSAFEQIAGLCRAGVACAVVTHDLNLAGQFAARLLLLEGGRPRACGAADAILRPEVLAPVYGERLLYGRVGTASGTRPFVLPWAERGKAPALD